HPNQKTNACLCVRLGPRIIGRASDLDELVSLAGDERIEGPLESPVPTAHALCHPVAARGFSEGIAATTTPQCANSLAPVSWPRPRLSSRSSSIDGSSIVLRNVRSRVAYSEGAWVTRSSWTRGRPG